MSKVVALGSWADLAADALAGVEVVEAVDPEAVRRAWEEMGADVGVVILTAEARRALPDPLLPAGRLRAVLPG